jgi:hypothetical protein
MSASKKSGQLTCYQTGQFYLLPTVDADPLSITSGQVKVGGNTCSPLTSFFVWSNATSQICPLSLDLRH